MEQDNPEHKMSFSILENDYDRFYMDMKRNNYWKALPFVRAILASN